MKKRWISVLALAVSAALLSGCNQGENSGQEIQSQEIQGQGLVALGEYKGLTLTAERSEFDDTDVELWSKQVYIDHIPKNEENGSVIIENMLDDEKNTGRPVEDFDITVIDYAGKKDGVAFAGGTAQNQTLLIGSGQFIAGFEEGLIGVMPGETVDLNLTFPENYTPELAGQEVVFTVTVKYIIDMTDERVGEMGIPDVTNLDGLRVFVRESLEAQAQDIYMSAARSELVTQLLANSEFGELPEDILAENREVCEQLLDRDVQTYYGIPAKMYMEMTGQDYEAVLAERVEQYTKVNLLVKAIADKEGLNISDEALETRLEEYVQSKGGTMDELFSGGLTKEDYKEAFLYDDVFTFLIDNSVKTSVIVD